MKVLIVEDGASARKLLRIILEHYGCTVIEAQDGEEGLDLAARHMPDIIISDGLMPRMDGFQLLRALKSDPGLASIPFIFYSSTYIGEKEVELALSLRAEAFVTKPVEPALLWEKICAIMEGLEKHQNTNAPPEINESDEQYLREYSSVVATKLEKKVHELEEALVLRTQAEAALKEQEQELATIFEDAPFILLLLDEERRVRKMNGMACSFTGLAAADMIGRRNGEILHCLHALDTGEGCGFSLYCRECVFRGIVMDTFETGQRHHQVEASLTLYVQGKEQTIQFLVSTTKVMVADKAMVLLSLQDISEYKKIETQLHHAQKMESIGTLAGGIAHDFNNILTTIFGYGDIALMNMAVDNPQRQNVEHMLQAAQRAASLAKDLLLFSRKQISNKNCVDLNEIVCAVKKFLLRVIGEDIACTISLDEGKLPVFADAHQLEQVLMNFATNARDAMPNGGTFLIVTERVQLDEEFIAAHGFGISGMYAVLTVTDTGIVMDDETLRQIFDPFFTTKEVGKGTGLGMSVAYGIIKQHDGHITVFSEPGLGTTFKVYLPITLSKTKETEAALKPEKPAKGTETILLAEDDEVVRNMAFSLLSAFGYEVIIAVDGEDAVQKFRENRDRIKLLLFDMIMPNKNGKDAFDEIREIEPDMKIIFSSGYVTDSIHQKFMGCDNVMLISKPYLPTNLLAMVRKLLNRSTAQDSE